FNKDLDKNKLNTNEFTPTAGIVALTITDDKTGTVKSGETITYTFTFDKAVTGFDIDDIIVGNGTKGTFNAVTEAGVTNGTKYTLEVAPNTNFEGDLVVSVDKDAATTANGKKTLSASNTQVVDAKNPIFESATLNSGETTLTLHFSEALTGVSDTSSESAAALKAAGFSVTDDNATTGTFVTNIITKVIVAADGLTAILTLASAVAEGKTVKVTYDASDAGANAIKDKAGNALADVTMAITTTAANANAPSIIGATDPDSITVAQIGDTLSVEISFNESVQLSATKTATITLVIDKTDGGTEEISAIATGASGNTIGNKLTFTTATLTNTDLTDTNGIQVKADSLSFATGDLTGVTSTTDVNTTFSTITLSNSQVDTSIPVAPINLVLADEDNSGLKSDNITNHTNDLTITGEAEAGTTVQLYNAGVVIIGATATVNNNGKFSIDIALTNNTNAHNITAKTTDAVGHISATSTILAITVDTTVPAQIISGISISTDTGIADDFITNTATQTLTATLSAVLGADEKLYYRLDGVANIVGEVTDWIAVAASNITGQDISITGLTLAEGLGKKIAFKVADVAGNENSVVEQTYMLNTTIPDAVHLSTNNGIQNTSTLVANAAAIDAGVAFDASIQTTTTTDI
ncbi:MAG: hypothetical protein FE834_01655, partial [Gammaproteobacteria bacterium]|nr:hypothetical protein [Gammaproteobacteria bacterium]